LTFFMIFRPETLSRTIAGLAVLAASLPPYSLRAENGPDSKDVGGLGKPPAAHKGRPGERKAPKKARPARRAPNPAKRRAKPKRRERRQTAVLPHPGVYRAPAILRLVGKLLNRPVRVESKVVNEIQIKIPNALGRRPLTLEELKVLLAANQLWVHLWDHPEKGQIVVASRDPNWVPEAVTYRKVLQVTRKDFAPTWESIKASVETHNAKLPENARRIVAVPHERTGKILLWSPKREWIEDLGAIHRQVEKQSDVGRPHLFPYRARHRPASKIEPLLINKLTKGERDRVHVTVAKWGNHLLFRCDRELEQKIRALLEVLDRPLSRRSSAP